MIVAFDGHDASGKTTLARAVAEALNARYTRPYDRTVGDLIVRLWRQGRTQLLAEVARAALDWFEEATGDGETAVCDRHAVSVLALLPHESHAGFTLPEHSFVCWADLETTLARERARGADFTNAEVEEQLRLLTRYADVALRYHLPAIVTTGTTVEEEVRQVLRSLRD
jgi:thymidylate kinase